MWDDVAIKRLLSTFLRYQIPSNVKYSLYINECISDGKSISKIVDFLMGLALNTASVLNHAAFYIELL